MAEEDDDVSFEPASIAHAEFPESQCSVWDCQRRFHFSSWMYCCGIHKVNAENDTALPTPILFSHMFEILKLQSSFCLKILDCFKSKLNPGIPDIRSNLLLQYPWLQPDKFGLKAFKREKHRGWIFVNPYEVDNSPARIWKQTCLVKLNNGERTRFRPNADRQLSNPWMLYRFSIVVDGDVKKGLFIMLYKPKISATAIAEEETLAPLTLSTEPSVTVLSQDTFHGIAYDAQKYVMVLFFQRGCDLCKTIDQTYQKVAGLFKNYEHLVFASMDVLEDPHNDICNGVSKHPTVMFFPIGHEEGEVIEGAWLFDLEDFICWIEKRIGLERDVQQAVQHPDGAQHSEPAAVALSNYTGTECSLWDCKRRVPRSEDVYCRESDKLIAQRDSLIQTPVVLPNLSDIESLEQMCLAILESLKANKNPGVPDIKSSLLLEYPGSQEDKFGLKFFKREHLRWYMFINPYEVPTGQGAVWVESHATTILNVVRTTFHLRDPDSSNWWLYRYSIISSEGDVTKGLFLMKYKPTKVALLTDDTARLAPLTIGECVSVLTDESFDDTVGNRDKDSLILFFKPGCNICDDFVESYKKFATILKDDETLRFASMDVSASAHTEICNKYGVTEHTLLLIGENETKTYAFGNLDEFLGYIDEVFGPELI